MHRAFWGWFKKLKSHSLIITAAVLLLVVCIFLYQLGSSPKGLSHEESSYRASTVALHQVYENPINAPHKLIVWAFGKAGLKTHESLRIISVIFGALFASSFYLLAKNWFGKTVGLLSALVFSLTPLFIITARQGTADILLFSPIIIMAAYAWLARAKDNQASAWLWLMAVCAVFLYVPGGLWWLVGGAVISRQKLIPIISELSSWMLAAGAAIFTLLAAPAIAAIAGNWHLIKGFALVPAQFPPVLDILKHLAWMLGALFVKAPYHDQLLIGRLPVLDIIQLGLLVFGAYALWSAAPKKALMLASAVLFSILAAGLNDNLHLLALGLPALGIFMAAGLRYLYIEWRSVFPRNPIPKSLALLLMIMVVAVQLVYGLSYSLLAWPHAAPTKAAYVLK